MMNYKKCPECGLKYISETEELCSACRRVREIGSSHLVRGRECGTNSRNVYEDHAARYGWDKWLANQFGRLGLPLYAPRATPEKFSVWMIAHSNWFGDKGGQWRNTISPDENTIEEIWDDPLSARASDFTTRVTFARNLNRQYEFLGVYAPDREVKRIIEEGQLRGVITYRCISKRYPIKTD